MAEAAAAIALCNGVGDVTDIVNSWHARPKEFAHPAAATKRLVLEQPLKASIERVFARLKFHFSLGQITTILNDYVDADIMLDHNNRDVAAAWY